MMMIDDVNLKGDTISNKYMANKAHIVEFQLPPAVSIPIEKKEGFKPTGTVHCPEDHHGKAPGIPFEYG